MGVPTRLRYNDASDGMTTIGTMLTGSGDNITTATLKNSADEYTKLTIEGNQTLQELMPVSESTFGNAKNGESEPEILVEVFQDGSWEVRDRVFAFEGGTTDDSGNYKNAKLYGFEKYHGEQRVEITNTINTNIEDALIEGMPPGYTVQVPGDVTPPNLNEFTFRGRRENLFVDLAAKHDWVIIFTPQLDGDDNYIVRFEPRGYGDSQGSIVRGQDPFVYDYWKKKDTKTVVSEVTVKGENSNGEYVQVTRTSSDIGETPDLQRSIEVRVKYTLGTDTTNGMNAEAKEIAENLIQSNFVEHGALEGPLFVDNTVNFSVEILDGNRNINDLYTVAMQKDYLHQGETYFSFEYEKNSNIEENWKRKGIDEERNTFFPSEQEDVGNQNVDADTEDVIDQYDNHNSNPHPHDVGGEQTTSGGGAASSVSQDLFDSDFSIPANDLGVITTADVGSVNQQFATYYITFRINPDRDPITGSEIQPLAPTIRVKQEVSGSAIYYPTQAGQVLYSTAASPENQDFWNTANHEVTIKVPNVFNGSTEEVQIQTGDTPIDGVINVSRVGEEEHEHSVPFISDRAQNRSDGSTNNTNPNDSSAGDTTSLNASGNTDSKNIDVTKKNNTNH